MHDATIDRCVYFQKGNVSDFTLSELEEMLVRQNGFLQILPEEKWAPVPSLETIFKNFKGLDIVLVVEIKSEEDNLVSVLKELIDSYDILDQVVVITSKESQVEHMRDELPEVPTATLHTMSATDMSVGLERLARLNCSLDMHYGDVKGNDLFDDFVFNLVARGYSSWFWTYDYEKVIWDSIKAGVVGITNNSPDDIADYVVGFTANKYVPVDLNTYNGELELEVISYDKTVSKVVAKEVYSYEEDGNKYAYFVYTFDKGFKNKTYQIYSGRLMLVSQDIYVSVSDMETILSKEVNELTKEEFIKSIQDATNSTLDISYNIKNSGTHPHDTTKI
jgi:glycerophosphoryl diester phosphodiesterase